MCCVRLFWRRICRAGLLLALAGGASAQDVQSLRGDVSHWAIAPFLGTGAYEFDSQQSIYVVAYTPRWNWRDPTPAGTTPRRVGLEFQLPASIGLRSFDLGDLPGTLDPGNAATLSIVPGVYATLELDSRWTLLGIANLGLGARLDGEEAALIHRLGIRSRYSVGDDERRWNFIAGIEQIGYNTDRDRNERTLPVSLSVEVEFAIDAWRGEAGPTHLIAHLSGSHFLNELTFEAIEEAGGEIRNDLEIGLALRPVTPIRLWRLRFERIGLAYRRGEGEDQAELEAIRLIFGSVFEE